MTFKAPNGSDQFFQSVISRVHALVDVGIWDIERSSLNGWIDQFKSQEERYFSSCILDSLIYRSHEQFLACAKALFRGPLGTIFSPEGASHDLELTQILQEYRDRGVRLVPVIRSNHPPTKSGPLVLRYIKRALSLNDDWMLWPWQVTSELETNPRIKTVIFVDDFLGSGTQFCDFLNAQKLELTKSISWIYAPVVAHESGISRVNKDYPDIQVTCIEQLTAAHSFFCPDRWKTLSAGAVTSDDALDFYESFIRLRGIDTRGSPPCGFGDLALCFGFKHSTPDNSLPILWVNDGNWIPLLER